MDCTDLAADIAVSMAQAVTVSMDHTAYAFGVVLVAGLVCGYLAGRWLAADRTSE